MTSNAIEIDRISKTYADGTAAVADVSFSVPEGSCFGFLGPNGAGKTTLMKMLYGMVRRDPRPETRVSVLGFDPARDELAIKHLSGVVPQDDNLDAEVDVSANLFIYSKFYGIPRREARARIAELLDFMELKGKAKAKIKDLSGGMKRRLVIARALLNRPRLLILDEPTTGLDPQVRQVIWDKVRSLKKDGATVLLTTHYMEEAYQIADSIIIMDKGRRVLEGAPRKLLSEDIEGWVMEVLDREALAASGEALGVAWGEGPLSAGVRREDGTARAQFFSDHPETLRELAARLPSGAAHIRPTNLEDLFLRSTGRQLNDEQ
jgi:lipooligosaccharide transport system ATP-binding protein